MSNLAVFFIMSDWLTEPLSKWLLNMPITDISISPYTFGDWIVIIEGSSDKEVCDKRKAFNSMIEAQGYGPENSRM